MSAVIRRLDTTRPVMSASDADPQKVKCFDSFDIIGINYNLEKFDALHAKFPGKPIVSSENFYVLHKIRPIGFDYLPKMCILYSKNGAF